MRETIELLIVDEDSQYRMAMASALADTDNYLNITTFDESVFEKILEESGKSEFEKYHVILRGYSWGDCQFDYSDDNRDLRKKTLTLVDDDTCSFGDNFINLGSINNLSTEGKPPDMKSVVTYVCKYTSADEMAGYIRLFFNNLYGSKSSVSKYHKVSYVGICSASGGTGVTSIAVSLADAISMGKRRRVFYLNFEEIPSTSLFFTSGEEAETNPYDITAYLYHLFENKNPQSFLNLFLVKNTNNVSTMIQKEGRNVLKSLNNNEFSLLFDSISGDDLFEYIVIDMGSELSENALLMIDKCEKILMIGKSGDKNERRRRSWIKEACNRLGEVFTDKLIEVENMSDAGGIRCIRRDNASFIKNEENIMIKQTGYFRDDILRLLEEVL